MNIRKHKPKFQIYTPAATKYLSLHCLWNLGGTLSLDPSTHSDGMQTVLSTPEHSCKLSYGWSEAEVLTREAFSHITGVRAPVTGSQNCPDGRRKFIFSKSLAQVGTPSCCSCAKGNKPPKNGYGGKFSLIRGGVGGWLIKTRQMEKERGKRLFSTLSQRCLNRTRAHIQNHSVTLICLYQNLTKQRWSM